jgi:uncharacterized membrane protein
MRTVGLREIATGVGLLAGRPRRAPWLWARVAGDVMDLGLLGQAFRSRRARPGRVAAATAAVAGVAALDYYCSRETGQEARPDRAVQVRKETVVDRSPEDLYRVWRDFQNLPRFMPHLVSVEIREDRRSHWAARLPGGTVAHWDAEIVEDVPNARIAWRTLPGSDVEHSGAVEFRRAPAGRGTIVAVEMTYRPGAAVGSHVAWLAGVTPESQVAEDLRRFKQLMETGEVATNEGPSARQVAWARQEGRDASRRVERQA